MDVFIRFNSGEFVHGPSYFAGRWLRLQDKACGANAFAIPCIASSNLVSVIHLFLYYYYYYSNFYGLLLHDSWFLFASMKMISLDEK